MRFPTLSHRLAGLLSDPRVACACRPPTPFSAPQPYGRRMSTVSLLPSGPETLSAAEGRLSLRSIDPSPPTSWDEV
jgi:hypothetical protein